MIFVKLLDELRPYIDVHKLGLAIINHVAETKETQTRFACRFIPIDVLCKAKMDDFKVFLKPILQKYFTVAKEKVEGEAVTGEEEKKPIDESKYLTWCMEFRNKNNNNLKKKEVLDFIFNTIDGRLNPVDLKNADLYVVVEVYRDLLMMGVVPRYKELKKFNLQSLIKNEAAEEEGNSSDEEKQPKKVIKLSELISKRLQAQQE